MSVSHSVGVRDVRATSRSATLESVGYFLVLAYIAAQCWAIPLVAVGGLNWGLWPTPADIVWVVMAPIGAYLFFRGRPKDPRAKRVRLAMVLFAAYAVMAFFLATVRFDLPRSQFDYALFSLFRLIQVYTVWTVASSIPVSVARQKRILQVLVGAGLVVAVAALLQQLGMLDYRSLVDHLPASPNISGAWSPTVTALPDAALGTLNYNRIYTAHFLAVPVVGLLLARRFTPRNSVIILILLGGMFFTQSRSSFVGLLIGLSYGLIRGGRFHSRALSVIWLVGVVVVVAVAIGWDPFGQGTIAARADTFSESLAGRFDIQQTALPLAFADPISLLFGIGLSNLGYFVLGGGFSPAHGQYITVLAELGAVGLVLFGVLYVTVFRAIEARSPLGLATRSIFIGAFASATFNDLLMPSTAFGSYMGLLFCLAGLGFATSRPHEDPLRAG